MSDALIPEAFADFLERNKYKSWMTGEALQTIKKLEYYIVNQTHNTLEASAIMYGFTAIHEKIEKQLIGKC